MPVTIMQVAEHILRRPARTGDDFLQAGLPMFGGCQRCEASIAAYNACPSKTGYLQCQQCIDDIGFDTVEAALEFMESM